MPPSNDINRHLKNDDLLPVYALVGSEPTLVHEALSALRDKTLSAAADFNRDSFRADSVAIEDVLRAAGTLPMMAPKRWVELVQIEKLKAKHHDALLGYLASPSPSTVLCLVGAKVDLRTKLGKALKKCGGYFSLEPPKLHELPGWIVERAQKYQCTIDRDAAHLLAEVLGADIGGLDMALSKLAIYVAPESHIAEEHIEALVTPTRVNSIFDLTEAVGERDLARAGMLCRNALGGGENALMLLAMIGRQLRLLLNASLISGQNVNPGALASELGVRPFLVQPLLKQAARYKTAELTGALEAVARADRRLKSTRINPGVVLDQLLLDIIPGNKGAGAA